MKSLADLEGGVGAQVTIIYLPLIGNFTSIIQTLLGSSDL